MLTRTIVYLNNYRHIAHDFAYERIRYFNYTYAYSRNNYIPITASVETRVSATRPTHRLQSYLINLLVSRRNANHPPPAGQKRTRTTIRLGFVLRSLTNTRRPLTCWLESKLHSLTQACLRHVITTSHTLATSDTHSASSHSGISLSTPTLTRKCVHLSMAMTTI